MKKVLLVDDDRRFSEAAARALTRAGFAVEEAADGLEAIDKALEQAPDVAVVDLIMPRVGGAQVVAFFRQNPYLVGVPVIVLSGVIAESRGTVDALDVELVLAKGPRHDTVERLCAGVKRLVAQGRGAKEVPCLPAAEERRQVVELLQVAGALGEVLDATEAGILQLDARGHIAAANRRAAALLGTEASALIGAELAAVVPRSAAGRIQDVQRRFESDLGPATRALTLTGPEQAIRATLASVWRGDARHGLVVTLTELTPRLDDQSRPTRLLQYVAHELRASLLIMEEHLRALADGAGASGDAGATLGFLAQEAGRLLRLLGDASRLHQTLGELTDLEVEPVDLVDVVKDSISGVSALAVPQGIEVSYRGPAVAPKVRADRDRLLQVLYNLLLNALRATPRGGAVRVEVEPAGPEVTTAVVDSGRGLTARELSDVLLRAQQPELFLPERGERGGLGLSIAHQIVRAHGGRLTADSEPGTGSRFAFALPRCADTERGAAPAGAGA